MKGNTIEIIALLEYYKSNHKWNGGCKSQKQIDYMEYIEKLEDLIKERTLEIIGI